METTGYILAVLVGVTMGLIGGGGSVLTVPIFVYLLGIAPVLATGYSLFVVGVSAVAGAFNNIHKGLICLKTAFVFAIPSFIAVYLTRRLLVPAIPSELFTIQGFLVTKDLAIMLFFAVILLAAAISMLRNEKVPKNDTPEVRTFNYPMIILDGFIVGIVTGIVGAGGGFLIIPALVLLTKLPMKLAIGTSLFIIAIKSLIGFVGEVQSGQTIDWHFLLTFTALAVVGIFLGGFLSNYISGKQLKKGFGWFVLGMGILIILKEIF